MQELTHWGTIEGMPSFGPYLHNLRKKKGLTLKQVEKAARVSNAYLSQLERGLRRPPHPDILKRLANVYGASHRELLIAAGYLEEDTKEKLEQEKVERAYEHVIRDPNYKQGTRLRDAHVPFEAKRFIVEMYEKMTGRALLKDA